MNDGKTPDETTLWVVIRCGAQAASVASWHGDEAKAREMVECLLARKPAGVVTYLAAPVSDVPDELRVIVALPTPRAAPPEKCRHKTTERGADIPRRHGSYASEVCTSCSAFRPRDHSVGAAKGDVRGKWRPFGEYAEAIGEHDLD